MEYKERNIIKLDKAGNYYSKHVSAMTAEDLHHKSNIAAELAYRDFIIDQLKDRLSSISEDICDLLSDVEDETLL